jgi:hypothetical protein
MFYTRRLFVMKNSGVFLGSLVGVLLLGFLLTTNGIALANSSDHSQVECTVSGATPFMYVGGDDGIVYASATIKFDDQCNPILVNQVRLTYLPIWAIEPQQQPVNIETVERKIEQSKPSIEETGETTILAVNTCNMRTWEQDVVGVKMIEVLDNQNYSWDNISVTLGQGSTSALTFFSWWHVNSGPHSSGGYHSSQVAWANGSASFHCDGGPFYGGGPAYHITLNNYLTMDYQGGCGGYGTYSGTLVPGGSVNYSVWRS